MIQFFNDNVASPLIPKAIVKQWIQAVAKEYDKQIGDISYVFCTDEKMLEINRKFLQHDYYTDIITFDYSEHAVISGDLFISLDTVASNAEKYNALYADELFRVMIHGILHLCGQDDKTPVAKKEMTAKENLALTKLHAKLTK